MRKLVSFAAVTALTLLAAGCGGEKTVRRETVTTVPAPPVIERQTTVETVPPPPVVEKQTTIRSGTVQKRTETIETED